MRETEKAGGDGFSCRGARGAILTAVAEFLELRGVFPGTAPVNNHKHGGLTPWKSVISPFWRLEL